MALALEQTGLRVASEGAVPVCFRGELVGTFRADLVVEQRIALELKTADQISSAHVAQLTHSLRATSFEIGFVMNFGPDARFRRAEFRDDRKKSLPESAPIPS